MLKHVAVKHPLARIVGDERHREFLARIYEDGVAPEGFIWPIGFAFDLFEVMSMQMHGVGPAGSVQHTQLHGDPFFSLE